MLKNKEISHSAISTIAISMLFVASFILSASHLSQQASAIHEGNATTTVQRQTIGGNTTATGATSQDQTSAPDTTTAAPNTTTTQNQAAAGGSGTETGTGATQTQTAATQEPPMNQNFVRQGTIASSPGQVAGTENLAFILPPRNDGGVYSGVLTYTASKPVEVAVIHNYDPQNSTSVPEEYGTEFTSPLPDGTGNIAITLFQPQYLGEVSAASVPFTGNALALHTAEEGPFTATYTVNAFATQPENANAPLEFTSAESEVAEDTAGDQGQDTAGDQGQDTAGDQGQDTGEDQGQDTGEDQGQDTGEEN